MRVLFLNYWFFKLNQRSCIRFEQYQDWGNFLSAIHRDFISRSSFILFSIMFKFSYSIIILMSSANILGAVLVRQRGKSLVRISKNTTVPHLKRPFLRNTFGSFKKDIIGSILAHHQWNRNILQFFWGQQTRLCLGFLYLYWAKKLHLCVKLTR